MTQSRRSGVGVSDYPFVWEIDSVEAGLTEKLQSDNRLISLLSFLSLTFHSLAAKSTVAFR